MKCFIFILSIGIFFCVAPNIAVSQKNYNISIKLNSDVASRKINVQLYEGFRLIPLIKDSGTQFSESINSSMKYPVIEVSYFGTYPIIRRYFINKTTSELNIDYLPKNDSIIIRGVSGMISFEAAGLSKFRQFAKKELERQNNYQKLYKYDFTEVDTTVLNTYAKYIKAVEEKGIQFIRKYPNSLYSSWLFLYIILDLRKYSKEKLLQIYNASLKESFKGSAEEKLILDKLDESLLALNSEAPLREKKFRDLLGSVYSIMSFKKKLVLVNVWATWCVPCVAEIPMLKYLYNKYKDLVEIVSFSIDTNEEKLRQFIKDREIKWINAFNCIEMFRAYGSDMGVPQLFLIDRNGKIVYSKSKSEDNELELLDKTLDHYKGN